MDSVAQFNDNERRDLFAKAAEQLRMKPAIVEKDFWVCWTLDALFSSPRWRNALIFKGGTSLSKAFHIINRFSEDIDLILDWGQLGITGDQPWEQRSNTGQEKFCKNINNKAAAYLADEFVPSFSTELAEKLGQGIPVSADGEIVTVAYPRAFSLGYVQPVLSLEIGPLAEWIPHATFEITPLAAEKLPELFSRKSAKVVTILAKRTFWEKATILHQQAMSGMSSSRYSRHYYDLAMLSRHPVKDEAMAEIGLLKAVVTFKQRFYRSPKAHYELAAPGTFRLIPSKEQVAALAQDYEKMKEMLFGAPPSFGWIIEALRALEDEINRLG
jgi:hypothetical protein